MVDPIYEFTDAARSVLIHTPTPPRAWMNYLWNDAGYRCSVSQSGGGESRYLTERLELTQITAPDGRWLYLRDDARNVAWSPGFAPLTTPLDAFVCEHNLAFTELRARKDGIVSALLYAVPPQGLMEVWRLTLTNTSDAVRHLSVFPLVHWDLSGNFEQPRYYGMYTNVAYQEDLQGLYAATRNPFAPHARYNGFLACSEAPVAYDAYLPAFLGPTGSPARPARLLAGDDCTQSRTIMAHTGGILQNKVTLAPGERRTLYYALGVCANRDEAVAAARQACEAGFLDDALAETRARWEAIIARCDLETPDARVNAVMNTWCKKQMIFCSVGKKGVRDNMQVADGILQVWPEGGREQILEVLSHQFQDGHTVLTWLPYDDTYYSDQPIWLVMGVAGYIKETGDLAILDAVVPYQDGGEGTVWEHLRAGLELKLRDVGPHGVCRIHFADWNDALNIGTDEDAESVFVSMGLGYMLQEMAALAERRGDAAFAQACRERHAALAQHLNEVAWTGAYYARAFHKDGVVGAPSSEGSTIYANPQSWAILGGIVPPERQERMLHSMDEALEHAFGLPINWPPYETYTPTLGRMSAFPPGFYENGGVYCHATAFAVVANAKAGRGAAALRLLKKIMPDSPQNPSTRSGAEPYVFTNCYFTHPTMLGHSLASWMTGTSAWCFKGLVEWILGVRRDYDGLRIDPHLPPHWPEARVTRVYRGATYHIHIRNPQGLPQGTVSLTVDGEPLDDTVLPVFADGREHQVVATIE